MPLPACKIEITRGYPLHGYFKSLLAHIKEVEKCQSIVGKFILQIPRSSTQASSNIDAGLRPIWSLIAERVLVYARSTMEKSPTYWSKIVLDSSIALGHLRPTLGGDKIYLHSIKIAISY